MEIIVTPDQRLATPKAASIVRFLHDRFQTMVKQMRHRDRVFALFKGVRRSDLGVCNSNENPVVRCTLEKPRAVFINGIETKVPEVWYVMERSEKSSGDEDSADPPLPSSLDGGSDSMEPDAPSSPRSAWKVLQTLSFGSKKEVKPIIRHWKLFHKYTAVACYDEVYTAWGVPEDCFPGNDISIGQVVVEVVLSAFAAVCLCICDDWVGACRADLEIGIAL